MTVSGYVIQWALLAAFAFGFFANTHAADTTNAAKRASDHLIVSFPGASGMMLGYLYRPAGDGPFPAVIFHHRDHKSLMKSELVHLDKLVAFFTSKGYMLFLPDRHPDTFTTDEFSPELQKKLAAKNPDAATKDRRIMERYEIINRDVVASVEWLKRQPDVNTNQVILLGLASGAMQSLAALTKVDVSAAVLFSPAATSWSDGAVVRNWLISSTRTAKAPILLIYTDDQSLAPATALGPELDRKGKPNRMIIYPVAGQTSSLIANFVTEGIDVWGEDALKFLKQTHE